MYDYRDKLKGKYGRRSVYDILNISETDYDANGNQIIREYEAAGIDKVKIDEITLTNYGQYNFIWEKTYVKQPTRSGSGNIGNLNAYSTFLTPHLILDFSIMSIDDYRAIMRLHYERNEYVVQCYDTIYNRPIKVKMYFATEEMAKLFAIQRVREISATEWEDWVELVGVQEYKVELIGTNNELDTVTIEYVYNAPTDVNGLPIYPTGIPIPNEYEDDVYAGEEATIGGNSTFSDNAPSVDYRLKGWNTAPDGSGTAYDIGRIIILVSDITLYAQWEKTLTRKLSFNYGLSQPYQIGTNLNTGEPLYKYDTTVQQGVPIGLLPEIDAEPTVLNNLTNTQVPAYENGGWYKIPVKDPQFKISDNDPFWMNRDTIAYCLYDAKKFKVSYVTNTPANAPLILYIPDQIIEYGGIVYLPELYAQSYTFQGWYSDPAFVNKFTGKMPPYDITLYAKW